ncbi:MAG: Rha family transcriptional regulator [Cetobacterium sp.]|uniref:Rha family transcriptional regulator n=1 Tax=Cetobacterium sp. TaxID=2071632 RepID=UPI003F34D6F4
MENKYSNVAKEKSFITAMTSLQVAEITGKEHKSIIRDIKVETSKLGVEIAELIFQLSNYTNKNNRQMPMYNLSNNGLKHMVKRWKYITPEQYKTLGINDIDVVYNHTRFEIAFGDMLAEALREVNLEVTPQYNVDGYKIDFYIQSLNIAIEYDEQQHFTFDNQKKDFERQIYIEEKIGAKFIRCDYKDSDIKNVMKVIKAIF